MRSAYTHALLSHLWSCCVESPYYCCAITAITTYRGITTIGPPYNIQVASTSPLKVCTHTWWIRTFGIFPLGLLYLVKLLTAARAGFTSVNRHAVLLFTVPRTSNGGKRTFGENGAGGGHISAHSVTRIDLHRLEEARLSRLRGPALPVGMYTSYSIIHTRFPT